MKRCVRRIRWRRAGGGAMEQHGTVLWCSARTSVAGDPSRMPADTGQSRIELNRSFDLRTCLRGRACNRVTKQADALEEAKTLIGGSAPAQAIGQIKTLSGLANGAGSGVRITQAELNALTHARGLGDSFEGWLNGMQGKGNLAENQVKQITSMLGDIEGKVHEKQGVYADTLDKLNRARSPQEVRQIESDLMRQQLNGNGGPQASGGHKITVNGKTYQYKGSGPTDSMDSYTEAH